ncbi:hypothetical protein Ocin01_09836 [Orchesella cincta]|uniref:Uncharacterized protein n=1 Tax=Orchesella cincta TaxID=48709 RepID=A0A1D2MVB6_ORCCI|nr:hypothetical protein Ocin01_09836 [Orchesella cincta]
MSETGSKANGERRIRQFATVLHPSSSYILGPTVNGWEGRGYTAPLHGTLL